MRDFTYEWYPAEYDDLSKPILKITKSSFGSYQWCPKKYEFSYPLRLPQDTSEPMIKGTVVHNSREAFFDEFDMDAAKDLSHSELIEYNMGLHPIDDYTDMYKSLAVFEAQRFVTARKENTLHEYLPVINEIMLDAEITVGQYTNPNCILDRDYVVHLQGIIDRVFIQDGAYIPMEFKTGPWKDYKLTSMRKEMAFYKLLMENASQDSLDAAGIDRDIPISHWGWYYPASNYIQVEPVKKQSTTAVYRGMTQLIKSYEEQSFPEKYYYKTCAHCSFFPICEKAQAESWL
tara:strand:- start:452 stop:1318 length:867 start_codon:yes stop_codon:yes gene_type:complete